MKEIQRSDNPACSFPELKALTADCRLYNCTKMTEHELLSTHSVANKLHICHQYMWTHVVNGCHIHVMSCGFRCFSLHTPNFYGSLKYLPTVFFHLQSESQTVLIGNPKSEMKNCVHAKCNACCSRKIASVFFSQNNCQNFFKLRFQNSDLRNN